jgi:hypothetical protein
LTRRIKLAARLRLPVDGLVLDACSIIRLYNCGALQRLDGLAPLHVAMHVQGEASRGGPAQKSALSALGCTKHAIAPGTPEWDALCGIRGAKYSTTGLGEDESIAVCLAEARRGRVLPLVTFDRSAAMRAEQQGVVTMGFLALLTWMVGSELLTLEEADSLEACAREVNGWKRPPGYDGSLEGHADELRKITGKAIEAWRRRVKRQRK